jgi:hypothetical protein
MAQRMVEVYTVGDRVEVFFSDEEIEEWRAGRVVGHQHPGVWVLTDDDRKLWFVTNAKRIRRAGEPGA